MAQIGSSRKIWVGVDLGYGFRKRYGKVVLEGLGWVLEGCHKGLGKPRGFWDGSGSGVMIGRFRRYFFCSLASAKLGKIGRLWSFSSTAIRFSRGLCLGLEL